MIDNFGGCIDDNMVRNDEVVGSIPTSSTKFNHLQTPFPKLRSNNVAIHQLRPEHELGLERESIAVSSLNRMLMHGKSGSFLT